VQTIIGKIVKLHVMLPYHVLIIEAGAALQAGLHQLFARWGFARVTTVETGTEALRYTAAARPDLVVLSLPVHGAMDGPSTARRLQQQLGHVPILLLVPEVWSWSVLPASWPGVAHSRCVPKPPTVAQLQQGVEHSLDCVLPTA
jgi:CheY-like chemotaxis protein